LKKRKQCNRCCKVGHWEKEHPKHDVPKDEKKKECYSQCDETIKMSDVLHYTCDALREKLHTRL
jgi:hypothetical protein